MSNYNIKFMVALYDYTVRGDFDIGLLKGDRMKLLSKISVNEPDWVTVKNIRTKERGLVPYNYIANVESLNTEDWYFDVSRMEAENLLLANENPLGTFLIRTSENNPKKYALSVKWRNKAQTYFVKHCLIPQETIDSFRNLKDVVSFYKKCIPNLSQPCPKFPPQLNDGLGSEIYCKMPFFPFHIKIIKQLNHGRISEVFYGKWRNKDKIAMKILHKGIVSKKYFQQEIDLMTNSSHKNLVALYGVFSKVGPIYLIQEYMPNDNLIEYFVNTKPELIEFKILIYFVKQIACGMEYLESKKCIHQNLAARNVLVGKKNTVKISDFGLARIITDKEYFTKKLKWTAPEAIIHNKYSIKSDVWSFGVVLTEVFTYGMEPYSGMSNTEILQKICQGYRISIPTTVDLPENIYQKLLNCWHKTPKRRPSFKDLFKFFDSYGVDGNVLPN